MTDFANSEKLSRREGAELAGMVGRNGEDH